MGNGRVASGSSSTLRRRAVALALAALLAPGTSWARQAPPQPLPVEPPAAAPGAAGVAVSQPGFVGTAPGVFQSLPGDVQVVRFHGPQGMTVEVLEPAAEPITGGDGSGLLTTGLRVGRAYRLRLSNLPNDPTGQKQLFPVVEIVGHLHRPAELDPARFPIRIVFTLDDITEVTEHGQLVTHVVYLEDPDQAAPISLPKDQIPSVTLQAAEEPLKVASALGRVMAIVRIGGRVPGQGDAPIDGVGIDAFGVFAPGLASSSPCPFATGHGDACSMPCGPVRGVAPAPNQRWMPKDEYLCDGGDHDTPLGFSGEGGLRGIDPRDALVRFRAGNRDRVLPTNRVCIYSPRFAMVRSVLGPNLNLQVDRVVQAELVQKEQISATHLDPKQYTKNEPPVVARHRTRASGLAQRTVLGAFTELRVLQGVTDVTALNLAKILQAPQIEKLRQAAVVSRLRQKAIIVRDASSAVVTGTIQSANQKVMAWKPQETVAVEEPPNRPGLAVVKQVSTDVAEPGDEVTFMIRYRNIGNTPITSASVIDSLLPRLEYLEGTAQGPKGTVFTSAENRSGGTELRWDLPGVIEPGAEGVVTFKAKVR